MSTTRFYPRCILEPNPKLLLPLRSVATRFDPCRREFGREASYSSNATGVSSVFSRTILLHGVVKLSFSIQFSRG